MELTYTDLPDGVRKIDLVGRLDVPGTDKIDLRFTALVSSQQTFAIVDLAGVDFIASIGIAVFIRNAKVARRRNGGMVLLNPQRDVERVLTLTKVDHVIPICYSLDEARQRVRQPLPD